MVLFVVVIFVIFVFAFLMIGVVSLGKDCEIEIDKRKRLINKRFDILKKSDKQE